MHESMERLHQVSGLIRKKDIAEKMGVAQSSVTNWGTRGLSEKAARQAAQIWNVDANYLMTGDASLAPNTDFINEDEDERGGGLESNLLDFTFRLYQMPVVSSVSIDTYKRLKDKDSADIDSIVIGWTDRPRWLKGEPFVFQVRNRTMTPEMNIDDRLYIDTNVGIDDLIDGDYVLVQHKDAKEAVLKMVVLADKIYVKSTNDDIPHPGLESLDDYELIGVVDSKLIRYR